MIVTAKLIKKETDDGLMTVRDHVELGSEYQIDLSTLTIRMGYNYLQGQEWEREMVKDVEGGWLPTEILSWNYE
jgi:hypothetical protein